ncbi:MAG: TIGR00730 family Rossman fold protein [Candidatus Scatovivens sp.]
MKICVYGAASSEIENSFILAGEELGRKMAEHGHSLVFGGGKNGMMGATARGVLEKGGEIIGIAPSFFEENNAEISFKGCTNFIHTETMRERKRLLDETSDAFIVSPGGIGTFDEFFEILTLKQLGRHNKAIVIFNINGYFDNMINMMQVSVDKRFITEDCRELYKVTSTIEETLEYIESYNPHSIDLSKVKIR